MSTGKYTIVARDSYNIPYYIRKCKKYKGWEISECEDVVLTSEVDKNI